MGERIGVRRLVWVAGLLLAACSAEGGELVANDDTPGSDGRPGPAGSPAPGADADTGGSSGPAGSDGSLPGAPAAPAPAKKGDLLVTVEADRGAASDAVVSLGVPFPPGTLTDGNLVTLLDPAGREVSTQRTVLATWPADKSVRSVLVVFRATLAAGAKATYTLRYGEAPKEPALSGLAANPDGPVAAMLPPAWYGASLVSGRLSPAQDNTRFAAFDRDLDARVGAMSPTYESYGVNCPTTSNHRTYYDGTHGLYTRFLRHGGAARLRRARAEATWYRQNELRWNAGRTLAWQVCQGETWTPTTMLGWGVLRRMTSQGMLDDYLITGDPAARAAVVGMGEAFRQNLPALTARAIPDLEVTERNMAWPLMGLAAYYAVDARPEVLAAAKSVADRAIAWQARGTSGAFEHDINRPDPSECEDGPAGASPFMTPSWTTTPSARTPASSPCCERQRPGSRRTPGPPTAWPFATCGTARRTPTTTPTTWTSTSSSSTCSALPMPSRARRSGSISATPWPTPASRPCTWAARSSGTRRRGPSRDTSDTVLSVESRNVVTFAFPGNLHSSARVVCAAPRGALHRSAALPP